MRILIQRPASTRKGKLLPTVSHLPDSEAWSCRPERKLPRIATSGHLQKLLQRLRNTASVTSALKKLMVPQLGQAGQLLNSSSGSLTSSSFRLRLVSSVTKNLDALINDACGLPVTGFQRHDGVPLLWWSMDDEKSGTGK